MNIKLISVSILLSLALFLHSNEIKFSNSKLVAVIENIMVFQTDVERVAKEKNIGLQTALEMLLDDTILYIAATTHIQEPSNEEIELLFKERKMRYANQINIQYSKLTDEHFINALYASKLTLNTYRELLKRELWCNKLITKKYLEEAELNKPVSPEEIDRLITSFPQYFSERESITISHIYLSFLNSNSSRKNSQQISDTRIKAQQTLERLKKNEDFVKLVNEVSDDFISKKENPPGRYGIVELDNPSSLKKFNKEISDEFLLHPVGVIMKLFETDEGIFIFKIDSRVSPSEYPDRTKRVKAEQIIIQDRAKKLKESIRQKVVSDYRKVLKIKIL